MNQAELIAQARNAVNGVLEKIEEAQALAAAAVQQYNKLGGGSYLSGFDWETIEIAEQEFLDAVSSLSTALPDILAAHGTNLYKVKI